mgnify:CR=1 FL=1
MLHGRHADLEAAHTSSAPSPPWHTPPKALLQDENNDLASQVDLLRDEARQSDAQVSRLLGDNAELMVGVPLGDEGEGF